jgi:hypothetical protein
MVKLHENMLYEILFKKHMLLLLALAFFLNSIDILYIGKTKVQDSSHYLPL